MKFLARKAVTATSFQNWDIVLGASTKAVICPIKAMNQFDIIVEIHILKLEIKLFNNNFFFRN
jgi:hypothetical protein